MSPSPELYTKNEWVAVTEPRRGDAEVIERAACIHLQRSGRGISTNSLVAKFRYGPESVNRRVEEETSEMFNRISNTTGPG